MKTLKKIFLILILSVLVFNLAGCSTIRGLGEDIEAGGRAIQDAAE